MILLIVVFLFHIAFILILLRAAITRFISYEGNMHIHENMSSNTMLSSNAYIDVVLESKGERVVTSKEVRLTEMTPRDYRMGTRIGGEKVNVKSTEYMSNATEQFMALPGGSPYLQLMIVTDRQNSVGIPSGRTQEVMGMRMASNNADTTAILNFISEGSQVYLYAALAVTEMHRGGQPVSGVMGDLAYTITYGSREISVPFSLFLKDFEESPVFQSLFDGDLDPKKICSELDMDRD